MYKDLGSPELLQQGRSPRTRSNPGSGGNSPQRLDTGRSNPSSPQQGESAGQRSPLPECSGYNASTGETELFFLSTRREICSLSGENLFYFSILILSQCVLTETRTTDSIQLSFESSDISSYFIYQSNISCNCHVFVYTNIILY